MIQETSRQPRISPLAGQPAPKEMLIDVSRVEREYHARKPDMDDPNQRVASAPAGTGDRP
jgi:phosphoglucomutase